MKTLKTIIFAFLSGSLVLNAQETQNRTISAFNKIETFGSVSVYYTNSDTLSLTVSTKSSDLENVETRVENGTLIISNKGNFTMPVNVYVKNNRLKQVQSSGASVFKTMNVINRDSISFSVSGSADIQAMVVTSTIKSIQSGASLLTLTGKTDKLIAELSGASSLKAYGMVSKTADVLATGASSSKIYVTDKLKANASGASDIKVKGEVTDINAEASSASSISKIAGDSKMNKNDSTVFNWRGKKIVIIDKDEDGISIKSDNGKKHSKHGFKHWAGLLVGVNGYMASPGNINLPNKNSYMDLNYGRSFNIQLNLVEKQFNIVKNYFKIITGIGFDYHSYDLSNKTNLNPDSSFTSGRIDSTGKFVYDKNRLRNTYLQVPILFEFNTRNNPRKTFHIAVGVIGQYLIASRTKQLLEQDKFEITKIRKDGYNMSPFAAKVHLNMGYRRWTIYAEYSLTSLFQAGKGPELYPFAAGLRIIPFG